MKTVEETLAELVDREEIRDLPVRYCDCVWRNDVAGIVDLFAADGSFTVKTPDGETVHKGREALIKTYTEGLRDLKPRPYIHNHVVELGYYGRGQGDATSTCAAKIATWNGSDPATTSTNT